MPNFSRDTIRVWLACASALSFTTVYDVTRPETFDNVSKWLEEVETYHPGRGREVGYSGHRLHLF